MGNCQATALLCRNPEVVAARLRHYTHRGYPPEVTANQRHGSQWQWWHATARVLKISRNNVTRGIKKNSRVAPE